MKIEVVLVLVMGEVRLGSGCEMRGGWKGRLLWGMWGWI